MKKNPVILPKFESKAFEENGGWTWQLKISSGKKDPIFMKPPNRTFPTKLEAEADCRKHMGMLAQTICAKLGLPTLKGFLDIKRLAQGPGIRPKVLPE